MAAGLFAVPLGLLAVARAADWYPGNGAAMSAPSASFYLPSPELLAQCGVMKTVKLGGGADFTSIQAAVNSLPISLSTNTCVVVADADTYSESVVVQNFLTNGYRLKIIKDPSLQSSPLVRSAGGIAAFLIESDSVTIAGIDIGASSGLSYGVLVSSAQVLISSVNVAGAGYITIAGIGLSDWNVVENSSVSVQNANAIMVSGVKNEIRLSTMAANTITGYPLQLSGASSNTVTGSYILNQSGQAARLYWGANHNIINNSTITSLGSDRTLYLYNSSSNTFNNSHFYSQSGYGVVLEQQSNRNEFTGCSVSGNSSMYSALYVTNSSSNTFLGGYISNTLGTAAYLYSNAGANTIRLSTITGNAGAYPALRLESNSLNEVLDSYIQGSTAAYVYNASSTAIRGSVLVSTWTGGVGLIAGESSLFVTTSSIAGGPGGQAVFLAASSAGKVELASNTITGGSYGLAVSHYTGGASLVVSSITFQALSPGATAMHIYSGTNVYNLTAPRFDSPNIAVNINASAMTGGAIYVYNPSGARASQFLANDPGGYVQWPWPNAQSLMGVLGSTVSVGIGANGAQGYEVLASTSIAFTPPYISSSTAPGSDVLDLTGLAHNTTYYIKTGALWDQTTYYYPASMQPVTKIEDPATVYIDEVGSTTIVASAYAPGAAFTNMQYGQSGVAVSTEPGVYNIWGGTGSYWTTKADMPSIRQDLGVGVIGGKLYAIGGDNSGSTAQNEEYDPATNSWTTKTAMLTARSNFGVGVVGGKVYAVGGINSVPLAQNEEYDPVLNTWAARQPLPMARSGVGIGVIGGKLYVVGGYDGANPLAINEEYDPALNVWNTKAPLPAARTGAVAGTVGGKLYALGGFNSVYLDKNEEYDPATNNWTTKTAMPTAKYQFGVGAVGGKLYALGGYDGNPLNDNEVYDPASNTWTSSPPLPDARYGAGVGAVGGKLYALGGYNTVRLRKNEEYTPGVSRVFTGLQPNTQYTFKAKARDQTGLVGGESLPDISTYTLAAVGLPAGGQPFAGVYASSAAVNWSSGTGTAFNGAGASYLVVASTSPDYLGTNVSSYTYNVAGATLALSANTTYYFRVRAYNAGGMTDYSWLVLGSTVTQIEAPTSVYVDEVTTTSIVASAYAPGPAFSYMERLGSGVSIARDGAYDLWGSTGNYWATKAPMPTARRYLALGAISGKIFAVGGYTTVVTGVNEEYDPVSNAWVIKNPMPTARQALAVGVIGGKLYALGGNNGEDLGVNEEYEPETNTWVTRASMPTARQYLVAGVVGGKLYAVGGTSANEEYDPVTNAWATKTPMPTARHQLAAVVIGGKLYAVGGVNGLSLNEVYDPVSDTWATKASMPVNQYQHAAGAVGGKLYSIGGYGGNPKVCQVYVPESDSWSQKEEMPTSRRELAAIGLGGKIFAIGGEISGGSLNTNEEYVPGVARVFSGLQPNKIYTFKAKARNQAGAETGESVEVSTYTLAAVGLPSNGQPIAGVYASSAAVNWSSGTGTAFNGPGASFLVVASTSPDYLGTNISSYTYNVAGATLPLASNTSYYFRVQAYNAGNMTDYGWLTLGSTVTLASTPTALPVAAVSTWTITAAWGANGNAGDTWYTVQASSSSNFAPVMASSFTLNAYAEVGPLSLANTYYYLRVNALNRAGSPTAWTALGSTATAVQTPTGVYVDEVGTNTITASAYAASTAFSGLHLGVSGVNVTTGTLYGNWTVYGDSWTTKTAMPTARYGPAAAVVGGKIYVVGGDGGQTVNEEYDPVSNSWVTMAAMPTARYNLAAAAVGGKLYALGGLSGSTLNKNEEYDPASGAWATRAAMPTARYKLVAAAVSGKIYAVGGYNVVDKDQNEEYDPATDTWVTRAAMPTARNGMTSGVLYGKLYVAGGVSGVYLTVNEEYDPVGNNWATRAAMPTSRHGAGGGVLGGKFYTAAGYNGSYVSKNEEYDSLSDAWTTRAVPLTARSDVAAAVLGGKLYLLGGSSGGFTDKNEAYAPGTSAKFSGLQPNTLYNFKAKARNALGVETGETVAVSTYTLAAVALPPGGQAFVGVYSSSAAVAWSSGTAYGGYNGVGARYLVHASTASNFSGAIVSSSTYNVDGAALPLAVNTTYYFRVQAYNAGGMTDYSWLVLGSTVTRIETPTSVYIDEVGVSTIVASAYAPSPAFTGIDRLGSGVSIARDGTYDLWGSTGNYWTTKTAMPTVRHGLAAAAVGGKLYAVGGDNGSYLNTNEEYDPAANSWATKTAMPTARHYYAAAAVGGKLYAVGGFNGSNLNTNEEYDPAANSWATKTAMPTARQYLAAAAVGGNLFAVGGFNGGYLNTNEEYDPAANSWATKTAMPTVRSSLGAAAVGGKLYAVGGFNGSYLNTNEEYDPATNSWATKTAMPMARYRLAARVPGKIV